MTEQRRDPPWDDETPEMDTEQRLTGAACSSQLSPVRRNVGSSWHNRHCRDSSSSSCPFFNV